MKHKDLHTALNFLGARGRCGTVYVILQLRRINAFEGMNLLKGNAFMLGITLRLN